MRFYTITAVSNFMERPLICTFHADMFHGLAERGGKEYPHDVKVWANSELTTPLSVSRTIRGVPGVSRPSTHLVVNEHHAKNLCRFQNIRLVPVEFKRLVDIEWKKGDMSWFETWGSTDPRELLRTLPEVPDAHQKIGPFFEVQTHRWKDIVDSYPSATETSIQEGTPPLEETTVIRILPEMLIDYPMFWWGVLIVNPDVFETLDADLDRDFFIVRKYEVT